MEKYPLLSRWQTSTSLAQILHTLLISTLLFISLSPNPTIAITLPFQPPPADVLEAEGVSSSLQFINVAALVSGAALSQAGWIATVDSYEAGNPPQYAIDGNPDTFWHSEYSPVLVPLPHTITIDMGAINNVNGLTYLPRQDGNMNGNIGQHQIFLSTNGVSFQLVAFGTFYDDQTLKSVSFESVQARYLRIIASTEAGNRGPWTSIAELDIYGSLESSLMLSQAGWTATADSYEAGYPPQNAIDGNPTTFWHSEYSPTLVPLPHSITVDTGSVKSINGFTYLPRQDGSMNGNIGQYQVYVSADGTNFWLVALGSFTDDQTLKSVIFAPTQARYFMLQELTEAGDRGPWSSCAEINIYQSTVAAISQSGWTATADSYEAGYPPQNAIDGNPTTFWHSEYSPTLVPLPHTITVNLGSVRTIGGITYLPRQDGNMNGNIGQYQIFVSTDGGTFTQVASGAFFDDQTLKSVAFATSQASYVRIVASTEAGDRGPWTTMAELNVFPPSSSSTTTTPYNGLGIWGPTIDFPLVPVAAAVMHDSGEILTWSSYTDNTFVGGNEQTLTSTYFPSNQTVSELLVTNTEHDMFCPGLSLDANGRMTVTGGNGSPRTSIYDPSINMWISGPDMNIPRGYQASATCSDGRTFVIGGSWSGGTGGKNGEIYDPSANSWSLLPGCPVAPMLTNDAQGVYRADNHGWLFGWSGGYVFQAGPSMAMNWYSTSGNGGQTGAGNRASDSDAMCGNAVMFDAVKGMILSVGGSPDYQGADATSNAHVITIGAPNTNPTVKTINNMANKRIFANAVVLPNGKIFVTGGQTYGNPFSDANAVFTPEMWNPSTNAFTSMQPNSIPRTYHSMALLLMDGTILSGGGGLCGTCSSNHFDAQIYTPPYLLNTDGSPATRPNILTLSTTTVAVGGQVTVTTGSGISKMSLIRFGSATHTVDTDQRRIALTFTTTGTNKYAFTVPNDPGIALPGYWMLFVLNSAGVPSVAKAILVT